MSMADQSRNSFLLEVVHPVIQRVWISRLQERRACNGVGRLAIGNLQHRRTPLAHIGSGIMISPLRQLLSLFFRQLQFTPRHRTMPLAPM
jgi:hypothetical protein